MKSNSRHTYISTLEDIAREKKALHLRLKQQEDELRRRINQVPGEMFYSSVDSFIPSFLSGKVSNVALSAGKGLINNFFVRRAVETGSLKVLQVMKPSGLMRKLGTAFTSLKKKKP